MIKNVLLDTGALVALLDQNDRHHAWVKARFDEILNPFSPANPSLPKPAT